MCKAAHILPAARKFYGQDSIVRVIFFSFRINLYVELILLGARLHLKYETSFYALDREVQMLYNVTGVDGFVRFVFYPLHISGVPIA